VKRFNRKKGSWGEEIAADYLSQKGFQILEKNYSVKFGEIDLIASKNGVLVFVEVKLKTTEDFGTPEEMIGKRKLAQVQRMAELYLLQNPEVDKKHKKYRIDAVCVVGTRQNIERINHYENVAL
jgi:putative endonuclease